MRQCSWLLEEAQWKAKAEVGAKAQSIHPTMQERKRKSSQKEKGGEGFTLWEGAGGGGHQLDLFAIMFAGLAARCFWRERLSF
jgi:hypothetical protein